MADLIARICRDIERRLKELGPLIEENDRLEAVLAALKDGVREPQPPTRHRAPYAGGKGQRAPRGANLEAILTVVRERPGISAREVAELTTISAPTVHTTISQLKRKGILEREGSSGLRIAAE